MTGSVQPQFSRVATSGITLHVAEAGPEEGPLLVLLHGFPEFWYGWRHQIGRLADAGFHVIVPDQRGYNLSDKPAGAGAYGLDQLAADVMGLADHYHAERVLLAGHDWGAAVGWWCVQTFPERVHRFIALSAPHPAVWRWAMDHDPEQRKKSRYVKLFAVPWLPEALLRARNFRAPAVAVCATARSGTMTEDDLAEYRKAWAQPGALTGGLNWYRALLRTRFEPLSSYRIRVPTLMMWGRCDPYGTVRLAEQSIGLCDDGTLHVFDDATHWLLADEPGAVTDRMLDFLRA